MRTSEEIDQIYDALSKAQAVIKPAVKNATNPHLRNKFADLASCWDSLREPLSANGLSISQGAMPVDGHHLMVTRLCHSSGQWIETSTPILVSEARGLNAMQSLGVAITYARRYGLGAITGLVTEEDTDGHDGQAKPRKAAKSPPANPDAITEDQRKRLFAISNTSGLSNEQMKSLLIGYGYESSKDILKKDYEAICKEVEDEGKAREQLKDAAESYYSNRQE